MTRRCAASSASSRPRADDRQRRRGGRRAGEVGRPGVDDDKSVGADRKRASGERAAPPARDKRDHADRRITGPYGHAAGRPPGVLRGYRDREPFRLLPAIRDGRGREPEGGGGGRLGDRDDRGFRGSPGEVGVTAVGNGDLGGTDGKLGGAKRAAALA